MIKVTELVKVRRAKKERRGAGVARNLAHREVYLVGLSWVERQSRASLLYGDKRKDQKTLDQR
jgi:hypothetical protein